MKGLAHTSPVAEPPNAPVIVAGDYKGGRVVAVGSYRLFSNYGAGLSLRNNRTFATNIFRWLARMETGKAPTAAVSIKKEAPATAKVTSVVPPKSTPAVAPQPPAKAVAKTTTTTAKSSIPPPPRATTSDQSVLQELESLRADISAMRDIIARLYSDSLGYLQEMKEEEHMI